MNARAGAIPELCAIVVHWGHDEPLRELLASWPDQQRCELVIIDNTGGSPPTGLPPRARWISCSHNLGFAGGVNRGMRETAAPALLLLNPDAHPLPGALEALLDGLARRPEASGLVPRLVGDDGTPQHVWQLRPLPSALDLLGQAAFLPLPRGAATEPRQGTAVAQPAAAALVLRRGVLEQLGGMDERFYPAWFEDVDLARRLAANGHRLDYWPAATFRHGLGSSVPALGYGPFLWLYTRNLSRYALEHHGGLLSALVRETLMVAALARLVLLPLRRPRRARTRREAARALLATAAGAVSGWRWPSGLRRRFAPPVGKSGPIP